MGFVAARSFGAIFIASTTWLVLEAPTTQGLARWNKTGTLTLGRNGLFEGDIILRPQGRISQGLQYRLWPNGIIPYVVDPKLQLYEGLIRSAMNEIESLSCLRFVPRTFQRDYVVLVFGKECSSMVGSVGGPQLLTLGEGCFLRMSVLHELMHAAGFSHEHSRPDRDLYLNVFPQYAEPDDVAQLRKMAPWETQPLSPFDYDSVMLYGSTSFARQKGLYTILTKDNRIIPQVWEKPGLSPGDVQGIRVAYECPQGRK